MWMFSSRERAQQAPRWLAFWVSMVGSISLHPFLARRHCKRLTYSVVFSYVYIRSVRLDLNPQVQLDELSLTYQFLGITVE